ncbi:nucleotidyltransferase family protein [Paenibacillus abyssi]|uniref:4-diphosphocytidyl-2C-methyl-D-erythritol kinase n=1 Tax=Paenibacillus abyssi TaxID=1340531 RepID=A0A917D5L5_9BACL|nr:nucleotidyltransferase family protein [Paenibacillus abyssi]GGG13692.1 4-diphosphocytidyl-2C-methyl-D-erythritol kinase [Paenibacillus abyssi]
MNAIGAVILAAGMSTRMGQPKQLLPLAGKPLFRYAVNTAVTAGLSPIVLVAGKHAAELRNHTVDLPELEVIENRDYASGMASSLRLGMKAITGRVDAAIICLADQPFVPELVIRKMMEHYNACQKEGIRIIRPAYDGVPGHPVLIDKELFHEFEAIQGDEGGKAIIKRHYARLKLVSFEKSEWGKDIDSPEDLEEMKKSFDYSISSDTTTNLE